MKKISLVLVCVILYIIAAVLSHTSAWSNRGYIDSPSSDEKQYIACNLQACLYGSETPKNTSELPFYGIAFAIPYDLRISQSEMRTNLGKTFGFSVGCDGVLKELLASYGVLALHRTYGVATQLRSLANPRIPRTDVSGSQEIYFLLSPVSLRETVEYEEFPIPKYLIHSVHEYSGVTNTIRDTVYPIVALIIMIFIVTAVVMILTAVVMMRRKIPISRAQIPVRTFRCPQCKTKFKVKSKEIESKKRPVPVKCPNCGIKGVII